MNSLELLKAFLQMPELSTVGTPEERAAFVALRIDGRTVREAGEVIGISKSHVSEGDDPFRYRGQRRSHNDSVLRRCVSRQHRWYHAQPWCPATISAASSSSGEESNYQNGNRERTGEH